jgi:ketosteroid isomerase-like protein
MKKIIPVILLLIACNTQHQDLSKQTAAEIIQADKDMSALALQEGFHKALLSYADDSVIKPQEGQLPVIGKIALEKYWGDKPDTKDLSWEPYKAEAAKSGDMGYSLGNWKMITKDTTLYGNYYTIWKKQADGKWKFTVDGGNNAPAPSK